MTDKWRAKIGLDLKSHKLNFYEIENPWDDVGALRQRFAEQWEDFGQDGVQWQNSDPEVYDDENENGIWDDNTIIFVAIHELSHIMTPETGHTPLFWDNMKYLLEKASSQGIYMPIDYSQSPV